MTPIQYVLAVSLHQDEPENVLNLVSQVPTLFPLFEEKFNNEEFSYYPEDATLNKVKFDKNGNFSFILYTCPFKRNGDKADFVQPFLFKLKVKILPKSGSSLKHGVMVLDFKYTQDKFAIHYMFDPNSITHHFEEFDIYDIQVDKLLPIKSKS